jgi:hypothetical protein
METPDDSERVGRTLTALPDSIPLVPKGAKLSYRHYRYVMDGKKKKLIRYMRNDLHPTQVLPRGGKTECTIQIGDQFYRGEAVCVNGDVFCYRIGRAWALWHALRAYYAATQEVEIPA